MKLTLVATCMFGLEKQVGELVKTVEDPSLLQETLVAVVIGCMGAGQAE